MVEFVPKEKGFELSFPVAPILELPGAPNNPVPEDAPVPYPNGVPAEELFPVPPNKGLGTSLDPSVFAAPPPNKLDPVPDVPPENSPELPPLGAPNNPPPAAGAPSFF